MTGSARPTMTPEEEARWTWLAEHGQLFSVNLGPQCMIEGCERPVQVRSLCQTHYLKLRTIEKQTSKRRRKAPSKKGQRAEGSAAVGAMPADRSGNSLGNRGGE